MDHYLERLDAETQKDNSFQEYLDWVQSQDAEDLPYQLPEDWLRLLSTVKFSDTLAVTNLRSALSFKKVDYLVLGHDPGHGIYFITSDPSALMLEEAESPVDSDLTGPDRLNIHPALLSLSANTVDGETPHGMPKVVLPVGRLFYGKSHDLLNDIVKTVWQDPRLMDDEVFRTGSRGRRAWLTTFKYFQTSFYDVPEVLEYLGLPPEDKAGPFEFMKDYDFRWLQDRETNPSSDREPDIIEKVRNMELGFTDRLFNILTGNAHIPKISPKTPLETLEKKRRELWHSVMQTTSTFKDTGYVAVIDAITPGHPVWLVESPQREDTAGVFEVSGTPHVAQLLPEAREWLNSYGEIKIEEISKTIAHSEPCPLVVGTVGLDLSGGDDLRP